MSDQTVWALSQALEAGHHLVTYNYQGTIPGQPTLIASASGKWVEENPELVTGLKAALAYRLLLESHSGEIDRDLLEEISELMVKYKVVEKPVDLDQVILD